MYWDRDPLPTTITPIQNGAVLKNSISPSSGISKLPPPSPLPSRSPKPFNSPSSTDRKHENVNLIQKFIMKNK